MRRPRSDPGSVNGPSRKETDISRREGKEIDQQIAQKWFDEKETEDRSCKIMGDVGTSRTVGGSTSQ